MSLAGGAAAALAPTLPRSSPSRTRAALALLAAPTLSGHALDRGQPRVLSVRRRPRAPRVGRRLARRARSRSSTRSRARPRTSDAPRRRRDASRRRRSISVLVLGASAGIVRALTELLGRLAALVDDLRPRADREDGDLRAAARRRLAQPRGAACDVFARLRRSATRRDGRARRDRGRRRDPDRAAAGRRGVEGARRRRRADRRRPAAALPPRDAVVDARELGSLAVAVAPRRRGRATVTLLGPDGTGVDGRRVTIDGAPRRRAARGCYRGDAGRGPLARVESAAERSASRSRDRAPDAAAAARPDHPDYRAPRTIVFDETLASSPTNGETTRFTRRRAAPLAYQHARRAVGAIVIGARRWDRTS